MIASPAIISFVVISKSGTKRKVKRSGWLVDRMIVSPSIIIEPKAKT